MSEDINNEDTLLEFPCDFTIKAMGLGKEDFQELIFDLVQQHIPDLTMQAIKSRQSSNGKYLSVSVTIKATSKAQLDQIYQSLSAHERVMMAL